MYQYVPSWGSDTYVCKAQSTIDGKSQSSIPHNLENAVGSMA